MNIYVMVDCPWRF